MPYGIGVEYIDDDGCENMDNAVHMCMTMNDAMDYANSIKSCDHVFKTFIYHCPMDDYNHWYATGNVNGEIDNMSYID